VAGRAIDRFGDAYGTLFGPRRPGLKLGAIGVIALALALIFAKGEHRATAKSVLEAELQRAAVAPFDGFVRAAPVRAVEARLSEHGLHLRPGMEGVAKIEAGRRSIVWIWMHPVVDWLRLAAWKYLP
jgi:hypothetical protein